MPTARPSSLRPSSVRLATYTPTGAPLRARSHLAADAVVLVGLAVTLWLLVDLSHGISAPFDRASAPAAVSTDPADLPYDAARSLLRMFAALAASTLFTFVYATAAARSRRVEKVLLPVLDVLQSVPVLALLSVTITFWLALFPHSELGVECASIFAIFTSQAWNMAFAFYQSLVTQPRDLDEAARLLRLTRWQRFWRLDVPGGTIPLVWNGMMSFGGGWFFLVASEVISVNGHTYALPGIGSYVAAASANGQIDRLLLAIVVMVVMVVGVNTLFWRPLTAWAERFRTGDSASAQVQTSAVLSLLRRSVLPAATARLLRPLGEGLDRATRPLGLADHRLQVHAGRRRAGDVAFAVVVLGLLAWGLVAVLRYISAHTGLGEFGTAAWLGLLTFGRVLVLLVVSTAVWVPVGVWIGLDPRVTRIAQPVVQVLASFPANFLFPFATLALISTGVSLDWGGILLMALGSQWYVLFNVIAGASAIPHDLREAATSMRLGLVARWRSLYGPAVFAAWVTGGITAAGGAWNASIVSEVVSYHGTTLHAAGLGAYIADSTASGDFAKTLVGVTVMSVFVVGLNRLFWRRLYALAESRFSLT
ncbi:ABC transporter permease [Quadrisphaera oryzae]|uniref:ABC transporter permease n=1 Tax=Quadrisphaera TaxID=317661 RepID=UPI0016452827|nr:ABC transporter permease subunit [Quadrisphaera sp. RL12-1S]MBC3760588.1 ABC transporter permease subunit [Quadrisphaera sp. RL12-1S]